MEQEQTFNPSKLVENVEHTETSYVQQVSNCKSLWSGWQKAELAKYKVSKTRRKYVPRYTRKLIDKCAKSYIDPNKM